MKFKKNATIPVGTIVYKKVAVVHRLTVDTVVLTCVVTKPGFCPGVDEDRKCRVAQVIPISAENIVWDSRRAKRKYLPITDEKTVFSSIHKPSFRYKLYRKATTRLNTDKTKVCASGIHVFLTKRCARNY